MKDSLSRKEAKAFLSLAPGQRILAEDGTGWRWQGTVAMTHHEQGVIWILTDHHERKLLDVWEHSIRREAVPGQVPAVSIESSS